jgi:hypothetical protein
LPSALMEPGTMLYSLVAFTDLSLGIVPFGHLC